MAITIIAGNSNYPLCFTDTEPQNGTNYKTCTPASTCEVLYFDTGQTTSIKEKYDMGVIRNVARISFPKMLGKAEAAVVPSEVWIELDDDEADAGAPDDIMHIANRIRDKIADWNALGKGPYYCILAYGAASVQTSVKALFRDNTGTNYYYCRGYIEDIEVILDKDFPNTAKLKIGWKDVWGGPTP